MRLRTSISSIDEFQQTAARLNSNLQIADVGLNSYEVLLDRAKALLTLGASDTSSAANRQSIASEIDSIRQQALSIANLKGDDRFLFGGTRQQTAPYDPNGIPSAIPNQPQFVQLEPGAFAVSVGVTAEMIFSNGANTIFAELTAAATALRGTGNPAADQAAILTSIDNITTFADRANSGRAQLGASMHSIDEANTRLENQSLSYKEAADKIEGADLAESALALSEADRDLQATLQSISSFGRRSLLDFLT